jgi:mono/diheme cytochrome c family protein
MKASRLTAAPCLLLFALTFAPAQTTADASLASNPLYRKNCAKCHGKTAEGRHFGGPSLISTKVAAASEDDLRNVITTGKGRMPRYGGKLSPEGIDQLVQQIKALNKK